jgi:F-type H+-transporting ATPase subunit a
MQRNRLVSDEVPETIPAIKPAVTAVTAVNTSVESPAANAVHGVAAHSTTPSTAAHGSDAHGSDAHGFDFDALNASHNMPYSAVEWVHGHPALILNAGEYAQVNWARLSSSDQFAKAQPDSDYQTWANEIVSQATYKGVPAAELAKAMTVARDEAWLGAFPKPLAFFNHQTFWSTIALVLTTLILLVFARRRVTQHNPVGRVQHMIEALVLFVRDDIVRPNIKHHPDAWVPYFGSLFIALLACNLFGLIPLFASATGNIGVTSALALTTAFLMIFMGIKENGPVMFWIKLVPVQWSWHPGNMLLWIFLAFSETLQLVIRPLVLAIRLFANMLAGHSVLLVFATLGFIVYASDHSAIGMSTTMGVFGWFLTVLFYALELLVALLQAYIFTLLSAVFIGLCAHPEH